MRKSGSANSPTGNLLAEPVALAAFFSACLDLLVVDDHVIFAAENRPIAVSFGIASRDSLIAVEKGRRYAVHQSFGRQILEGPGRFTVLT